VSNDYKKELELFYLTRFKEFLPTFPKGEIVSGESPDFLVKTDSETFGIEVTRLFRESQPGRKPLQAQENLVAKIVNTAKNSYETKGLPAAWVTIHFDFNFNRGKNDIQKTADAIFNLVAAKLPREDERLDILPWASEGVFPPGIHLISVKRYKTPISNWSGPHGSFVPKAEPSQIQKILSSKSPRVEIYRKKCDKIWLIIVIDRLSASLFSSIPEMTLQHLYAHSFDLAFLFFNDFDSSQKPPFLLQKS
jgi:hypothetical protein